MRVLYILVRVQIGVPYFLKLGIMGTGCRGYYVCTRVGVQSGRRGAGDIMPLFWIFVTSLEALLCCLGESSVKALF